ncbi:MAG: tetratricopeptide repeat protein [Wenzhouxiangella sp.]
MTLISGLVAALAVDSVPAQQRVQGVECSVEREVSVGALTEQTYNRLTGIYEDIGEERYDEAYSALETLLARTRREEYEQAVILQAMGHVRMQQDQPADAISFFQRAIDLNRLPNSQHFEMILMIAQIYHGMERFQDALDQIDLWFCVIPPGEGDVVQVWLLKASIHAQIDQFRQALDAIDRAIALSDEPREQWYQLKLGMHLELNEFREGIEVLEILIPMNPTNKNHWLQMSALYLELGNEERSMSVLKLAYHRGLLDRQSEFMQLSSLLQSRGAPRRAAEVMEDGLSRGIIEESRRNWEVVAGAWYQARDLDRALVAFERAGAQSTDGKIDLQRGFLLVDLERWEDARDALTRALELGGLNEGETGNAWLLIGMSHFNLGDPRASLEAFNQASNYSRVRAAAREWINHVREQSGRRSGP